MKKNALIILHEIYGINQFIKDECQKYEKEFDVFCPNLLDREPFSYAEAGTAYEYFQNEVGFGKSAEVDAIINELKKRYEKVFVLGFSVGATLAWRCSTNSGCHGVIGVYGSRIRDYLDIEPACETLLIFAKKESFDVEALARELQNKENATARTLPAEHGYMDRYSGGYDQNAAVETEQMIRDFFPRK